MENEFEGDWLGRLMEESNKGSSKPVKRPTDLDAPVTPLPGLVRPSGSENDPANFQRFVELGFWIEGEVRKCYYGFHQGGRDIFWLEPSEADHHKAFAFDIDPLDRERLYHRLKEEVDVTPLGKLRSKPTR